MVKAGNNTNGSRKERRGNAANAKNTVNLKTPASRPLEVKTGERERLHELFMQAPAMIVVLRGPSHIFELANPSYRKLIGEELDIIGKPLKQALPHVSAEYQRLLDKVYRTGKPFIAHEMPAKLDWDGKGKVEEKYFNFVYQPYKDTSGKVIGIFAHGVEVTDQVTARKKVEESEEYFRASFEQSAVGMAHTTVDGKWLRVNQKLCNMFGYDKDELLSIDFQLLTHPDDMAASLEVLRKFQEGQINDCSVEKRYIKKDGSVIFAHVTISCLRDEAGLIKYFISVIQDITEQKKAENELKKSEERLALAQQAANIGTFELNLHTGEFINTVQLEALYELPPGKLAGKYENWLKRLHPDDQARVKQAMRNVVKAKSLDIEFRIITPNGAEKWIAVRARVFKDANGNAQRLLGICRNITKRKVAEALLSASEERFRFMAESMPQKIFTATPAGSIDYFNPQWMEFTGLSFEEIKDWGWTRFIHPDDVEKNIERWKYSISTGEAFQIEHRFRRYDGRYRWHISRARAMRGENGKIIMWVGSNTDIHDIKLALAREHALEIKAASLAAQRAQLVALNKAKDEFISIASHQLRTPATGVKQYLGMVLQGYAGEITTTQRDMLRQANESNERQINIINDLLQVAHVDAGKVKLNKKRVDLIQLIDHMLNEQASRFKRRRQKVIYKHKQDSMIIVLDEARTRMALDNLLDNASKYSPEGKTITVEVSQTEGQAHIHIQDEGVGISNKDINKLFRKFIRLDNPLSVTAGGTGLGLYWVKKIVDLHEGAIDVSSEPNQGTTFTVKLPI